jgi:hypothetical protein
MFSARVARLVVGKLVYAVSCLLACVVIVVSGYAHKTVGQVTGLASGASIGAAASSAETPAATPSSGSGSGDSTAVAANAPYGIPCVY